MLLNALPSIILSSLSIPIVMQYRILPIEGTPYWLFGLLFILLGGKIIIDLYTDLLGQWNKKISVGLLIIIVTIVLGGSTITAIVDRHRTAPVWGTHDIVLQLEAAMRYLIQGKNPYKETYFGTPVEMFHYDELGKEAINPALYHFVMPPWYLVSPFPIYGIANRLFGYFDVRMVSLLIMMGSLIIVWNSLTNQLFKELAVVLLSLSPATVHYFIEGRSDAFALFWLIASIYFLIRRNFIIAAIVMGLGIMSKQTIWFAYPLWCVLVYKLLYPSIPPIRTGVFHGMIRRIREVLLRNVQNQFSTYSTKKLGLKFAGVIVISLGVAGILALPFLLWDYQAFFSSVVLYLSNGGKTGYPISGYGFSMVLYEFGFVTDIKQYVPFIFVQLGIGLPFLYISTKWLLKNPDISKFYLSYAVFLSIVWYFSRYFNNSHIAFLSTLFMLGVVFHYDEEMRKNV